MGASRTIDIYFDLGFFLAFLAEKPVDQFSSTYSQWLQVLAFFQTSEHIRLIDVNSGKYRKQDELKVLLDQWLRNRPSLLEEQRKYTAPVPKACTYGPAIDWETQKLATQSLFLVSWNKKLARNLSEKVGFPFLTATSLPQKWSLLMESRTQAISNRKQVGPQSWKDFSDWMLPANEIYLTDPYIGETKTAIQQNLIPFLLGLIPEKAEWVHLLIQYGLPQKPQIPQADLNEIIRATFQQERPNLTLSLAIIQSKKCYHDRHVFTNFQNFMMGHGINFFGRHTTPKDSSLTVFGLGTPSHLNTAHDILRTCKRKIDQTLKAPSGDIPLGDVHVGMFGEVVLR